MSAVKYILQNKLNLEASIFYSKSFKRPQFFRVKVVLPSPMSEREINLDLDNLCVFYPLEKNAKLVEDICHHFAVTVAAVVSSGHFEAVLGMH